MRGFVRVAETQTVDWTALPKKRAERDAGLLGHPDTKVRLSQNRPPVLEEFELFACITSLVIKTVGGNCAKLWRVGRPVMLHLAQAYVTLHNNHALSVRASIHLVYSSQGASHDWASAAELPFRSSRFKWSWPCCFWRPLTKSHLEWKDVV